MIESGALENGHGVAPVHRDAEFIPGRVAAKLFRNRHPDSEAADAINRELKKLNGEAADDLDHRH
jgi:hypothetical protein